VLELLDLRRTFGDKQALRGVTFSVGRGEMVGFVGPNGAGKTTAMRIVLGILDADRGEVRWRGQPLDRAARRRFGYMPEERGLYPRMTGQDQLEFFATLHGYSRSLARRLARDWLDRLGVGDRAADRLETLSLGNQQRVQLAAALVHDPEALVLDEPFSGLDPDGVDELAEVLDESRGRGVAIVFSSHQLELVERLCEKVAIIRAGEIVAFGPVAELRREHAAHRVRVVVDGSASAGWAQGLDGVSIVEADGNEVLLELSEAADEQRVLYEAQIAGRLCHFSRELPSLTELFRESAG